MLTSRTFWLCLTASAAVSVAGAIVLVQTFA